ncbi:MULTISPECIES: DUF2163 domain-containing protein [unclassified Roseitalea]|uniref:DUF2163 domain-containing protein n=1 Tax=unclassified Roseitalea TaxID=2639107 RepID=UPI00273F1ADC|nr:MULTISPECIES: DUF2163 domain-containing protein [unclassified Roseitalea]
MKPLHPDLDAHLQSDATTVCLVWIVTRADGVKLGFTDHDRTLEVDGVACAPATGFTAGAAEASLGLSGDMSDVAGVLSSAAVTEADIEAGVYDGAQVALYLVNWQHVHSASLVRRYHIGEITRQGESFRVELRSLAAALDQPKGRYYTRHCDAELGDARCGVNLSVPQFSDTGAVAAMIDPHTIELTGLTAFETRWYDFGTLRFDGGPRQGDTAVIATARRPDGTGAVRLVMQKPVGDAPVPGDPVTVFAGCDKAFRTCRLKFANEANFRGFPHMPGDDRALTYVGGEEEFDGGPIVP